MQKSNDFEVALHTESVSPDNKIRQILEVLLLYDPAIETHDVVWEFNGKSRTIKKFEEFPYYLYKAIWDADFKVCYCPKSLSLTQFRPFNGPPIKTTRQC